MNTPINSPTWFPWGRLGCEPPEKHYKTAAVLTKPKTEPSSSRLRPPKTSCFIGSFENTTKIIEYYSVIRVLILSKGSTNDVLTR